MNNKRLLEKYSKTIHEFYNNSSNAEHKSNHWDKY